MTRDTGSLFQNLAKRSETHRFFVLDGLVLEVCVLSPVQGGWRKKPDSLRSIKPIKILRSRMKSTAFQ